jgi:hypothetical protein
MTTFTNFYQPVSTPFRFSPTLDGQVYNVVVSWNLFGARYYINIYDVSGTLIVCRAMVGSPVGVGIESLTWANGIVTIVTSVPHGFPINTTILGTVSGCTPDAYNGTGYGNVTGLFTITYALAADPGGATALGNVNYNISLTQGYFASTLVWREANQQFEVSP